MRYGVRNPFTAPFAPEATGSDPVTAAYPVCDKPLRTPASADVELAVNAILPNWAGADPDFDPGAEPDFGPTVMRLFELVQVGPQRRLAANFQAPNGAGFHCNHLAIHSTAFGRRPSIGTRRR